MNANTEKAVKALVEAKRIVNEVDFVFRYGSNVEFPPDNYVFWKTEHRDGQGHKVRFCWSATAWCDTYWSWKATVVKRKLRLTDVRMHALRKDASAYAASQRKHWDDGLS